MGELPELVVADAEERILQRDLAYRLFGKAPATFRRYAILFYVDGLQQEEVAARLGCSRRTVINRLRAFQTWARDFG
jgi:DNA-directed RNA polymerase specialized sigma24 family protein